MKNNKKIKNKSIKNRKEKNKKASQFDPFGSHTGVCCDGERPVQDQDDL